jgi:hypothetical protein
VQTRIASSIDRLLVTVAASLSTCASGSPCGYTPRWHRIRLNSGLLVNQP